MMLLDALDDLFTSVEAAASALATSRKVPGQVHEVVDQVTEARERMSARELRATDTYLLMALDRGLLATWRALDREIPEERRRATRVALEQVRQALRDLRSEAPVVDPRPAGDVARWVNEVLDAPQREVADLLGVSPRQYQRWLSDADPTDPHGDDARRLRVLARLVANLRHVWTGPGVIAWLNRPHPQLDGVAPAALLDDVEQTPRLRRLAASTRSTPAA